MRTNIERPLEKGFTLIEMAVVLMLFGVIVGGGLVGFGHFAHQIKTKATEDQFDLVFNALSTYAQRHKRLPCPADPDGDGTERMNGLCFNNSSNANLYANTQGVVPWRELGLPESVVRDGWGRFITYKPAPQLTANYLDPTMQNFNTTADTLDINDACRSPTWFSTAVNGTNVTHTHVDRAKAMFCCSTPPRDAYLDAYQTAGASLPANWRNQAVMAAGAINNPGALGAGSTVPNNVPVQSTGAWSDDLTAADLNGDFDRPDHHMNRNGPDAPLARSMNKAVTLISHGGNGFLSFMQGRPADNRSMADVNGGVNNARVVLAGDEQLNVWPPQVAAGTTFHPKLSANGAYDPLGRRAGASDDRVAFLRTDQLFSRAGSASCLRPADFDEVCIPGTYDDVIYLLDNSGSMNCGLFSSDCSVPAAERRINIAKDILREIMRAHMTRELRDDEDFDRIGYSGFNQQGGNAAGPQYNDDSAFLQTAFYENDLNNDGVVNASDDLIADGVFDDADLQEAVRLYNIARNGVDSSDYDGYAGYSYDDLVEARVDFAMDEIDNTLSGVNASGCTPVIESTQKLSDVVLAAATTKICRQLVVERDGSGNPLYGMPADCNPVIAEYNSTTHDAFITQYNPEPFDPAEVDPGAIVLMSDGNDTCSQGRQLDANGNLVLNNQGNANHVNLPNLENLYQSGQIDQVRQIYQEQGAAIAAQVAAFNRKFNDAFAANGDNISIDKQLHVNIVDVIGNEGLQDFAAATGGTRSATSNTTQIMQNMAIFSGSCPPNS